MAGGDDLEAWVSSGSAGQVTGGKVVELVPGGGEAVVDLASVREAAVDKVEGGIGDEVADVVAAADG